MSVSWVYFPDGSFQTDKDLGSLETERESMCKHDHL